MKHGYILVYMTSEREKVQNKTFCALLKQGNLTEIIKSFNNYIFRRWKTLNIKYFTKKNDWRWKQQIWFSGARRQNKKHRTSYDFTNSRGKRHFQDQIRSKSTWTCLLAATSQGTRFQPAWKTSTGAAEQTGSRATSRQERQSEHKKWIFFFTFFLENPSIRDPQLSWMRQTCITESFDTIKRNPCSQSETSSNP